MSLPDHLLDPDDDEPCEECGASWHTTQTCPVRRDQAAIEWAEERLKNDR
jgi:hypothetical protein